MTYYRKTVGAVGEAAAATYLIENGYRILERNFRTRIGEIDIIAEKNDILTFIEVKTKTGTKTGMPYEQVTHTKLRHLRRIIEVYLIMKKAHSRKCALDVISIVLDNHEQVKELKHYQSIDV